MTDSDQKSEDTVTSVGKNEVQDDFIDSAIESGESMAVFLANGVRLIGTILRHDNKSIVITTSSDKGEQLIYKAAIATILPSSETKPAGKR